LTQVC